MRNWSLSDLSIFRPVTVTMALLAALLLGAIAIRELPLAFMPESSKSRVRVSVDIDRTSPDIVERELIRPLEEAIAGMRGLEKIRTSSGSWGVNLRLEYSENDDIDARKLELRERIDRLRPSLPAFARNFELSSEAGPADEPLTRLRIASQRPLTDDYYQIEELLVRPIERIRGVARVELSGISRHELEVSVDAVRAERGGVQMSDIGPRIREAVTPRSYGVIRETSGHAGLRTPVAAVDEQTLHAIVLPRSARSITPADDLTAAAPAPPSHATLTEVADIRMLPQDTRQRSRLNGKASVELSIYPSGDASVVDLSNAIRRTVDELREHPRLDGMEFEFFQDQGQLIMTSLVDLRNTGLYGGLIGIAVLFAFLRRIATTLTAAMCIPLSVLCACGGLFVRGGEINSMVLLGLVLGVGMLIDNAVVIVESIQQQLQRGLPPRKAALVGAREVGLATLASTFSSVIVFLPLVLGGGSNFSDFIRPLGTTFIIALVASLLVSQTIVPLAAAKLPGFVRGASRDDDDEVSTIVRWAQKFADSYARFIGWTLRRPLIAISAGLLLCSSAYVPLQDLDFDLKDLEEQPVSLPIALDFKGSRGLERILGNVQTLESALLPQAEALGIRSLACNYRDWRADCDVFPARSIESAREMSEFEQAIEAALPAQEGVIYHLGESRHYHRRARDPRVVRFVIHGDDMATLLRLADRVTTHLQQVLPRGDVNAPELGGYDHMTGPMNEGGRELHVIPDRERLAHFELSAADLARQIRLAFDGINLGAARGREGEIALQVTSRTNRERNDEASESSTSSAERDSTPQLAELATFVLRSPDGREIPLESIARFEYARTPWWVQRVDRRTEIRMAVNWVSPDNAREQHESVHTALAEFDFPPGYGTDEPTPWWQQSDGSTRLWIDLLLSLALVYAVMASLFESFLQPLGILITCLLGCLGAPWAMWLTETPVDLVAMIGLFILIGIVVNNGIMLVDKVTQLRAEGRPRHQALVEASRLRLRPIIMTATTTIFGLIPMLIHHPTVAGMYYHGIAIIIVGGLLTSTLMTLIFLPSVYAWVDRSAWAARHHWRAGAHASARPAKKP